MICQNCNFMEANVRFTQIINGNKAEMYLCENCAAEKGLKGIEIPFGINDFLSSFISMNAMPSAQYMPAVKSIRACKTCGMEYDEFLKSGRLGCVNCYSTFGNKLNGLVKKLHGNVAHKGKVPGAKQGDEKKQPTQIESLKQMLTKAIEREEYEQAARIRDEIRKLEG